MSLSILMESYLAKEFDVKHYLCTWQLRAAAIKD